MAERKFGVIPDWAKAGPISLRNYNYRAEAYAAAKSAQRAGEHPTIRANGGIAFKQWQQYFDRHLQGRPLAFKHLCNDAIVEMTVPEELPHQFDPTFQP